MQKCTSPSGRHSWKFIDNFIQQFSNGKSIRLSKKGRYKCTTCNHKKTGSPQ